MEIIYFFIGAVSVAVLFTVGWLLKIVQIQIKKVKNLEQDVQSIVSNDITEMDVRGIVDSRVDKHADNVSRELEIIQRELIAYNDKLDSNSQDNMNDIHRRIDGVRQELMEQININRVGNKRNITNGDLQNEY